MIYSDFRQLLSWSLRWVYSLTYFEQVHDAVRKRYPVQRHIRPRKGVSPLPPDLPPPTPPPDNCITNTHLYSRPWKWSVYLIVLGSKQTGPVMNASNSHSSPTRTPLGYEQQGLFSSRLGSSPREGSPDKTGQYLKLEYPNGVIIHDTRNQGRIPR